MNISKFLPVTTPQGIEYVNVNAIAYLQRAANDQCTVMLVTGETLTLPHTCAALLKLIYQ